MESSGRRPFNDCRIQEVQPLPLFGSRDGFTEKEEVFFSTKIIAKTTRTVAPSGSNIGEKLNSLRKNVEYDKRRRSGADLSGELSAFFAKQKKLSIARQIDPKEINHFRENCSGAVRRKRLTSIYLLIETIKRNGYDKETFV
jgi:hypothetical protein